MNDSKTQSDSHETQPAKNFALGLSLPNSENGRTQSQIADLRKLVESLPLTEKEYQLVTRRLNNSQMYLNSGQDSAAKFEIKHVAAALKKQFALKDLLLIWANSHSNN